MKKQYILLVIGLAFCSMLMSGCNKKVVEEPKKEIVKEEKKTNKAENESIESEYKNLKEVIKPGYEKVDEFLEEESINKRFQGVALVAEGDEIKFAKAYGYADADKNRENELTTRFAIASNTKQFTAVAIMQLVEKNKIKLDETIDKYFPKYKYGSSITVKDLLQMRSGIPDYLNEIEIFMKSDEALNILKDYKDESYFDKYVQDERWSKNLILDNLYLCDLLFEPNEAYDYCNTNYYLLGLIIEEVSGLSFDKYVEENIFKPAKMLTSSMEMEELDAKGHGSNVSGQIAANPDFTYAAGNIYANVFDMLRWNRMLHKGNLITRKSYEEVITPVDGYGYGLFINDGVIRHSGVIDGFNSNTEYDPITDTTIIVMENCDATTDILDAKYDTSIIRELIKK